MDSHSSQESLPLAIARQRDLIGAWFAEYVRDYPTDSKVVRLEPGAPPVRD